MPIPVPPTVTVDIDGRNVKVTGPKGSLAREVVPEVRLHLEDGKLVVTDHYYTMARYDSSGTLDTSFGTGGVVTLAISGTLPVNSLREFIDYAKKNLVLVEVDFPRSKPQAEELKKANQVLQEKFKIEGYPGGVGRRKGDTAQPVAAESGPTMVQSDIDNLFKSARMGQS